MVGKPLKRLMLFKALAVVSLLLLLAPSAPSASADAPLPAPVLAAMASPAPPETPAPPAPPERPGRRAPRAWLGVFLSDSDDEEGVVITGVHDGSPADEAGLEDGDRITEIEGQRVETLGDLRRAMRNLESGDSVQIKVDRKGKDKTVTAKLGEPPDRLMHRELLRWAPEPGEELLPRHFMGRHFSKNYLGVRIQPMTEDLRAYFKAPKHLGLLVSKVENDTPAAKAGLRAGDVVINVDGKDVSDRGDIHEALDDHEAGDRVPIKIIRDGSERTLEVEIAERPTPKARRGALALPADEDSKGRVIIIDRDGDADEEDLDVEAIPGPDREQINEQFHRAMEQARLSQVDSEQIQRQVREAMDQVRLSQISSKEVQQQVREAMKQAAEAVREAHEAAKLGLIGEEI